MITKFKKYLTLIPPQILLVLIALFIGLTVGLFVIVLDNLIIFWEEISTSLETQYLFVIIPFALFVSNLLLKRFPEAMGDGTSEVIELVNIEDANLKGRVSLVKTLITSLLLGVGVPGGKEGPLVHIGGSIGSKVSKIFNLTEDERKSFTGAGVSAAIGASFNAPLAGILFAMEVIFKQLSIKHLSVVVVSSVSAAVVAKSFGFNVDILTAPEYQLGQAVELVGYLLLAILSGLFAGFFIQLTSQSSKYFKQQMIRPYYLILLGLIFALSIYFIPDSFGTGEELLSNLINGGSLNFALLTLVILLVTRFLLTTLSIGSNLSVGAMMPSLLIGALLGSIMYNIFSSTSLFASIQPGALAIVGMASLFAGISRAPMTSIIMVFEITGDYGLVVPLMFGAIISTLVSERVVKYGMYDWPILQKGKQIKSFQTVDVLENVMVKQVAAYNIDTLKIDISSLDAIKTLQSLKILGTAVIDEDTYKGMVSLRSLQSGEPSTTLHEYLITIPFKVYEEDSVSDAVSQMVKFGYDRVPVFSSNDDFVAIFSKSHVSSAYLLTNVESVNSRKLKSSSNKFFEVSISKNSPIQNKQLASIKLPSQSVLVSVSRKNEELIANGSLVLQTDDILTFFGTSESYERIKNIVNASV
ncbi:MAG: chloride channel protein [Candidatus Actinomarina sp.]